MARLRQADAPVSQGRSVVNVVHTVSAMEVTPPRLPQASDRPKSDQARRLKDQRADDRSLWEAMSDLALDKLI